MKINVNNANIETSKDIPFENLDIGDLFYSYNEIYDNGVYVKIVPVWDGNDLYNAVSLSDGSIEYIRGIKLVKKLDGELNVKFCLD